MSQLEDARRRAIERNKRIDAEVLAWNLEQDHVLATQIRAFLLANEQEDMPNNIPQIVKFARTGDVATITVGPQIDKGVTESHFRFDSGARLSFGITLRKNGNASSLISYRFHYVYADQHSPAFIRFDLNGDGERSPLDESRCHVHPGQDKTRVPGCVLSPLEVLDRIFYVLDRCSCGIHVIQALNT